MTNKTFDLDDYITQRKEKDSEFAAKFDTGYEEFKIGMMIKEMRIENGMTQEQLAEKANISRSTLSAIEVASNSRSLTVDTLYKIADALGTPAGDLLNYSLPASNN